jgi:hypothetical protein
MKEITKALKAKKYNIKEQTASDIKKNRFFVTIKNNDKQIVIAQVVYSNKKTAYQIKANRKFTKAEYHESWSMKYARKFDNVAETVKVVDELKATYKKELAEKTEKAETKKTEAKQKAETKKTETKQKTRKTNVADLQKLANKTTK